MGNCYSSAQGAPRLPGRPEGSVGACSQAEETSEESSEGSTGGGVGTMDRLLDCAVSSNQESWQLSAEQEALLLSSWRSLRSSAESVGAVTFLQMMETHPGAHKPFMAKVNSLDKMELDEWYRDNLRVHAIRIMTLLEKVVNRLGDPRGTGAVLCEYGMTHRRRGVSADMLGKMADSFLVAIQPYLEDQWDVEMESAWRQLFRRIVYFMKVGYLRKEESESPLVEEGSGGSWSRIGSKNKRLSIRKMSKREC